MKIKAEQERVQKERMDRYNAYLSKKVKMIDGLPADEFNARQAKAAKEKKEARKRHLERAYAAIDKSQIKPEDTIFKTVTRDQAYKTIAVPNNSKEMGPGRYNPVKPHLKQPCFVRIDNDSLERKEQQGEELTRCDAFIPRLQYDEQPQVCCQKLDKQLKNFKHMIQSP